MPSPSPFARVGSLAAVVLAAATPACAVNPDADEPSSDVVDDDATESTSEALTMMQVPRLSWQLFLAADLAPDARVRFAPYTAGTIRFQLDVKNVGNLGVTAQTLRVRIGGRDVDAGLWRYNGDPAHPENFHTIDAGGVGYLVGTLPTGTLGYCRSYTVWIDVLRAAQSGTYDPFANDVGTVSTPCLRWTTPVNSFALEGLAVDPLIQNKSLQSIVSSVEIGRADGLRCSFCHYAGSGRSYSPNVAKNAWAWIGPNDMISGRTWAQAGGWAQRFSAQTAIKPYHLRSAFDAWRRQGAQ